MAAQYSPPRSGGEYFAEFKFLHTFIDRRYSRLRIFATNP